MFVLRDSRKELYPLYTMTSTNVDWERGGSTFAMMAAASPLQWQGADGCRGPP
jgi:hypothetical protein